MVFQDRRPLKICTFIIHMKFFMKGQQKVDIIIIIIIIIIYNIYIVHYLITLST